MRQYLILLGLSLSLSGCLARVAADIVTAPIKVASKGVDVLTTNQSESDEKRGKQARHSDERIGNLIRERDKQQRRCERDRQGDACDALSQLNADLEEAYRSPR